MADVGEKIGELRGLITGLKESMDAQFKSHKDLAESQAQGVRQHITGEVKAVHVRLDNHEVRLGKLENGQGKLAAFRSEVAFRYKGAMLVIGSLIGLLVFSLRYGHTLWAVLTR